MKTRKLSLPSGSISLMCEKDKLTIIITDRSAIEKYKSEVVERERKVDVLRIQSLINRKKDK
jgi:hypothetical protein